MSVLLRLFWAFLKIGILTFGGGYAMIPLIQEEAIANGWMTSSSLSLVDYIAISESTPGPFAINIATFIGMNEAGILGAIMATLGVVLPSFIILMFVARFFARFSSNLMVKSVMKGFALLLLAFCSRLW
ncbi:MAG: chromate transporter [Candidatus Izemoplasmatales bacterium]